MIFMCFLWFFHVFHSVCYNFDAIFNCSIEYIINIFWCLYTITFICIYVCLNLNQFGENSDKMDNGLGPFPASEFLYDIVKVLSDLEEVSSCKSGLILKYYHAKYASHMSHTTYAIIHIQDRVDVDWTFWIWYMRIFV